MLNWRLTGRQNLEFYARVWGANGSALTRDVEAAADAVEGLSFLDQTVGSCSTGQRRRLMLAVALLSRAPVLLFDEPFADLDEDGRKVVCKVTEMWTAAGGVVISATPIEADAPPADVVFHLVDGKVEARS
jgi:ABC-type multidrug transport system ATPase subunit